MAKNTTILLGISPGTITMGFAVMGKIRLADWGVKNFRGKWSEAKLVKIISVISEITEKYKITAVVIKVPDPSRSSYALDRVVLEIKAYTKRKKIQLYTFSLDDLKNCFTETTAVTKREMVAIATAYDHLLSNIQSSDDKYYIKVLEAISLTRVIYYRKNFKAVYSTD
jgi:glycerophosphoryl diester phosphodiesterase